MAYTVREQDELNTENEHIEEAAPQRYTPQDDPMENTLVHKLLVGANRVQAVPAALVALVMVGLALVASLGWWVTAGAGAASVAGVLALTGSAVMWLVLWLLPRTGRSYGPHKPSALALSGVQAVTLLLLGLLPLPAWTAGLVVVGLVALTVYSTWVEPFRLGVTHESLTVDGWRGDVPPLKLLQFGDMHLERITQRERALLRIIDETQPDVIVFTGDYVNISYTYDETAYHHIREVISGWRAPLGVYCVSGTGTVEPLERVREFVDGLDNLTFLEDRWMTVETPNGALHILGMANRHDMDIDRALLADLMQDAPQGDGMRLAIVHAPDVAPEADAAGFDLYVCGHTHGGQLRFPLIGAVFSGSHLGMRFVMGRYELPHGMTLYTSRGVGLEGLGAPRARFLCPPEVVLWEISGAD